MKWVKDLIDGDYVNGPLLVVGITKGVTDKGQAYLNVTLQDKTGSVEAKKWEVTDSDLVLLSVGNVVFIEGTVNLYKNMNQLKIATVTEVRPEEVDFTMFQKVSPIPLPEMKKKLEYYLNSFKDKDVELITKTVIHHFYDKYITYPAAVRIHHEFGSGILHHSLAMADLAEEVAKLYPQVDRDILIAGCLMHDIGKTIEYEKPMTPSVTVEGKLAGHISIMYGEFKKIVDPLNIQSEVPLLLEHMILAHHGTHEFGSPVLPSTREAMLLSMIDLLDSRMMVIDKAMEGVKPGEFTQKIWAMDNICFYNPKERK